MRVTENGQLATVQAPSRPQRTYDHTAGTKLLLELFNTIYCEMDEYVFITVEQAEAPQRLHRPCCLHYHCPARQLQEAPPGCPRSCSHHHCPASL